MHPAWSNVILRAARATRQAEWTEGEHRAYKIASGSTFPRTMAGADSPTSVLSPLTPSTVLRSGHQRRESILSCPRLDIKQRKQKKATTGAEGSRDTDRGQAYDVRPTATPTLSPDEHEAISTPNSHGRRHRSAPCSMPSSAITGAMTGDIHLARKWQS